MTPSPERSTLCKPALPCSRLRPSHSRSALLGRDRSCGRQQRRGHSQGRKPQSRFPTPARLPSGPFPEAEPEAPARCTATETYSPEPLILSEANETADESLFHVTPSSSPASTKMDPDRELDDLSLFLETKEALSPARETCKAVLDFSVDVDIQVSDHGDGVTVNVHMGSWDNRALGPTSWSTLHVLASDSDDSTTIDEVEDVDVFGEDDEEDVEAVEPVNEACTLHEAFVADMEFCQVIDEEADDIFQIRREELTMTFATKYTSEVIESVLHQANGCGGEPAGPPPAVLPASTCATVEAPRPGTSKVHLEVATDARQAASPTRPATSRSLISSRSRRRIIGAIVRSPAPAEAADAGLSLALPSTWKLSDFDPTSPKASSSSPSRSNLRSKGSKGGRSEEKCMTKKKSMTVFRMDVMDEASPSSQLSRCSSLARGYDALGAEIFSIQDRVGVHSAAGRLHTPMSREAVRFAPGPETDFGAGLAHSVSFGSAYGHSGLSRVQSASALALDLGLEQGPTSPRIGSPFSKMPASIIRSSSTGVLSSTYAFPKSKKLQVASPPMVSKRQGLLPELPTSPSSAGSIAWSMRLAKTG
eukprot:CAMPEP_0175644530 /NCGR_PEP_ID=MMETSP0097-20121207/6360_1 /TAXON_ID=311494 /ORGANISM="Alexandrium monilatum, Strain CCMP3105" /LENGTH=590 /DNA_ID=CAMNT_0016950413 /DNA_START=48 /DNA_END=1816 /DNA_ORIENTATION=-